MATVADAAALREIYLPYVRTTAVTFELEDPTLEDFTERVRKTLERYPYIRMDYRGKGVGRRLYETLAKLLVLQNVFNMEACIAHCDPADEYVPATSRLFHERLGFKLVGKFNKCAHKFGRWYDMIWMERILGDHIADPQPFLPLPQVDPKKIAEVLEIA